MEARYAVGVDWSGAEAINERYADGVDWRGADAAKARDPVGEERRGADAANARDPVGEERRGADAMDAKEPVGEEKIEDATGAKDPAESKLSGSLMTGTTDFLGFMSIGTDAATTDCSAVGADRKLSADLVRRRFDSWLSTAATMFWK